MIISIIWIIQKKVGAIMNKIEKVSALYYHSNNYTQNERNFKNTNSKQPRTDQISFPSNNVRYTLEKEYKQLYSELKEQYGDIDFITEQIVTGRENTQASSIRNSDKKHILYITDEYMKQLFDNEDTYLAKTDILKNIANKLSQYTTKTSVWLDSNRAVFLQENTQKNNTDATIQALENFKQLNRTSSKLNETSSNSSLNSIPISGIYSKIANASAKEMLYDVINDIQKELFNLQVRSHANNSKEQQKIRLLIQSLQKGLTKCHEKIKMFDKERSIELEKKTSHKKKKYNQTLELQKELENQKSKRYNQDKKTRLEGITIQSAIRQLEQEEPYDTLPYEPSSNPFTSNEFQSFSLPSFLTENMSFSSILQCIDF